ncbi:MAG: hypothetical protein ACRBCL_09560 [Maritimibacter sp.]
MNTVAILNNMSVLAFGAIALSGCMAVPLPVEISREISIEGSEFVYSAEDAALEDVLNARSGTATFAGGGFFAGATDDYEDRAVTGIARLELNFDDATLTGEVTDLESMILSSDQVAAIEDGTLDEDDAVYDYKNIPGRMDLSNGVIWGETVDADISGTFTGHDEEIVVSGSVIGQFYWTYANILQFDHGEDFSVTVDGEPLNNLRFSLGSKEQ